MTDVPPQDQPPPVGSASPDETERSDRTRRVSLPPDSQAASTRRRPSQQRSQRRRAQPRSSSAARAVPPPQAPYPPPVQQQPLPQRRARRTASPPPTPPSQSGLYVPWWSLVVMVMIVGGIAFGMVFMFSEWSAPQAPGDQPARIQIITSQPTLSQDFGAGSGGDQGSSDFWPTAIPQAQPTATVPLPTPVPSPSLPPGNFTVGARVMVVGVGTNGLNVRSGPGYTGTQLFLAYDDEIYALVDGPQTADGLEWWKIEDPTDPARAGWAARNYLTVQ